MPVFLLACSVCTALPQTVRASETKAQTSVRLIVGEEEKPVAGEEGGRGLKSQTVKKSVQTGDTDEAAVWIVTAGTALAVCVLSVRKGRQN